MSDMTMTMTMTRRLGITLDYGCTIDDIKAERGIRLYCDLRTDVFWMRNCLNKWRERI